MGQKLGLWCPLYSFWHGYNMYIYVYIIDTWVVQLFLSSFITFEYGCPEVKPPLVCNTGVLVIMLSRAAIF